MAKINIQIVNRELDDLGIDQEGSYVPYVFPDRAFGGYWFANAGEDIKFYVHGNEFLCENNKENLEILKSML